MISFIPANAILGEETVKSTPTVMFLTSQLSCLKIKLHDISHQHYKKRQRKAYSSKQH